MKGTVAERDRGRDSSDREGEPAESIGRVQGNSQSEMAFQKLSTSSCVSSGVLQCSTTLTNSLLKCRVYTMRMRGILQLLTNLFRYTLSVVRACCDRGGG